MVEPTRLKPSTEVTLVRDAILDDMSAITSIYRPYVENSVATFEHIAPTLEEMDQRFRDLQEKDLPFLTAEHDGQVVGYAYASLYRSRWGYRYTIEDSVYVDEHKLGQGIGRRLLTQLIDRCAALGFRQMVAVIGDSENVASIALHSQLGFKVIGALPASGRKFGRWIDTVLMQRPLGDGSATPPPDKP